MVDGVETSIGGGTSTGVVTTGAVVATVGVGDGVVGVGVGVGVGETTATGAAVLLLAVTFAAEETEVVGIVTF